VEQKENEFYDLMNWRNYERETLRKRLGGGKVFSVTEATGSKVRGVFTYITDAGVETYLKMCGQKIFKSTGGSWTEITAGAPTWADADCYFAQLKTVTTGVSSTDSGTNESSTATTLVDTDKTFTVNAFVGMILTVGSENKLITANDTTTIYIQERFDTNPSAASYTVRRDRVNSSSQTGQTSTNVMEPPSPAWTTPSSLMASTASSDTLGGSLAGKGTDSIGQTSDRASTSPEMPGETSDQQSNE
jgi:hypothetical protein